MCGIFGYVHEGPKAASGPSLDVAIAAMRHRGPDGQGTFVDRVGDTLCSLAHVRLAIIDLSPTGRQPMSTSDGRYTITYNGEVYNYRDVRAELEAVGERFVSTSDTEVILLAYRHWGDRALTKLRGMFAFAIWDSRERRLFLARDRLGVKPLYFARAQHTFTFASEVRTLLAVGAAERVLSGPGLASYLSFGSASEPGTILRDVEMLPAGCFAYLHDGDLTVRRYWDPPLLVESHTTLARASEEVRSLLEEAISLRLVADVPVAVFLSGGMDSAAITALASRKSVQPLESFTISLAEKQFDETQAAAETAQQFGTNHHVIPISPDRASGEIDAAMAALDQPSVDGINSYFVAKAVRGAGQVVALSGIGGDEIFAGYRTFRTFRTMMHIQALLPARATGALQQVGKRFSRLRVPTVAHKAAALLAASGDPYATYVAFRAVFTEQHRTSLMGRGRSVTISVRNELMGEVAQWMMGPNGDFVTGFAIYELTNYLRNTLLRDTDVMGMAHGLEIREPLLDHALVERALSLPAALKLSRRQNKPLLAAAVPELAGHTTSRRKTGFTLPFEAWLRGPLRGWAEERINACTNIGVLDGAAVTRVWQDFSRDRRLWSRVWTLVALSDWCQRHRVTA